MKKATVLLAGGGTGGHIFPLVPIIRDLREHGVEVTFIGPEEFSLDVLRKESIDVHTIVSAGKLRRYFSLKTLLDIIRIPVALIQSLLVIKRYKPDVLLGKGGYGSGAPVIAARMLGVPVVLHESDTVPGLANRLLQRFADHILLAFVHAKKYFPGKKVSIVGNPVRLRYRGISREKAQKVLGLETNRKIIFIMGGSQGAKPLNTLAKEALPLLLKRHAVIISVGEENMSDFSDVTVNNAVVKSFLEEKEYAAALSLADIVVSRAGAGSIFDIAAAGKPSIVVPISISTSNHQKTNAQIYEEQEATIVLNEREATGQVLAYATESVLTDTELAKQMSKNAQKFATLHSAKKITDILLTYAKKS